MGYVNPIVRTPHIDSLAREGVCFRNAFVTTPISAASRASLLTGMYERTHGYTFRQGPLKEPYMQQSYPAACERLYDRLFREVRRHLSRCAAALRRGRPLRPPRQIPRPPRLFLQDDRRRYGTPDPLYGLRGAAIPARSRSVEALLSVARFQCPACPRSRTGAVFLGAVGRFALPRPDRRAAAAGRRPLLRGAARGGAQGLQPRALDVALRYAAEVPAQRQGLLPHDLGGRPRGGSYPASVARAGARPQYDG